MHLFYPSVHLDASGLLYTSGHLDENIHYDASVNQLKINPTLYQKLTLVQLYSFYEYFCLNQMLFKRLKVVERNFRLFILNWILN